MQMATSPAFRAKLERPVNDDRGALTD